ncbi:class II SORL domain-containing protein [Candidatus Bathyarchaeota archaeon]|nr:class II SORL domain-containing protein [Candidatus Bathyarchaeota archaeon]
MSIKKEFSLTELNRPLNWNDLPDMAKKHVPIIYASDVVKANESFVVKIKIGGIDGVEHPNTLTHWINWVALYAGERLITKIEFGSELSDKYVANINITLNESTTLKAKGFCNLHGVWEGKTKKIIVQEPKHIKKK